MTRSIYIRNIRQRSLYLQVRLVKYIIYSKFDFSKYKIKLGATKRTDPESSFQLVDSQKAISHPDFSFNIINTDVPEKNDIALIKMKEKFKGKDSINKYLCLIIKIYQGEL